jgi:hypothetical protein
MVKACLRPTGRRIATAALGSALMLATASCKPEFEERSSGVSSVRILAVKSEPAEAWPGTTIQYRALSVDQAGPRPDLPINWAYCTLPRPASELNDTTLACFGESGPEIVTLPASGVELPGKLPESACNQFGPDLPNVEPGEPVRRPADPDATGGYYQPLRLLVPIGGQYLFTLAETRIRCNLPGATGEVLTAYRKEYRANTNPALTSVVAFTRGSPDGIALTSVETAPGEVDAPLAVVPGERVLWTVTWADCPVSAHCGDGVCTWDEAPEACPAD